MKAVRPLLLAALVLALAPVARAEGPAVREAVIEPPYQALLANEPVLLELGGAKVITRGAERYFIAVGCTSIEEASATDRLRQIRIGRLQALKNAAEFARGSHVASETRLTERTEITTRDGQKSATTSKVLDEATISSVQAAIRAAPQIGTWKSADGKLFFYAIGSKLP